MLTLTARQRPRPSAPSGWVVISQCPGCVARNKVEIVDSEWIVGFKVLVQALWVGDITAFSVKKISDDVMLTLTARQRPRPSVLVLWPDLYRDCRLRMDCQNFM